MDRTDRFGHPKLDAPEKARQGIQLTNLAVDPETSKVVEQIFAWRVEGVGFRTIAARLSEQGFPCPSAADGSETRTVSAGPGRSARCGPSS